ncbi:MAG: response regulator transcription factor [Sphaerochaetaceae bacterium]|nr:response regulator transcription factor [Sphaerochaetaceae bacterium]
MIRIAVVDDHDVIREGIKKLIETDPDLLVVGEAGMEEDVIPLITSSQPDILLLDIFLNTADSGLKLLKEIHSSAKNVKVLFISMFSSTNTVENALTSGAAGFLPKTETSRYLLEAIHLIAEGKIYVSPEILTKIYTKKADSEERLTPFLTAREKEILYNLGQGFSSGSIARKLDVSRNTITSHIENMKHKLGISTSRDLSFYAIQMRHTQEKS